MDERDEAAEPKPDARSEEANEAERVSDTAASGDEARTEPTAPLQDRIEDDARSEAPQSETRPNPANEPPAAPASVPISTPSREASEPAGAPVRSTRFESTSQPLSTPREANESSARSTTDAAARSERRSWLDAFAERPETTIEVPRARLAAQSRRDFLIFTAGTIAAAVGAWWLIPDRTKSHLLPGAAHDRLDTLAARIGLSRDRREKFLDRALTFDDDVAEALYSRDRRVRTYDRSEITALRNNYDGQTPGPEYLASWTLSLSGLASGRTERLSIEQIYARLPLHEQVTRLVCVEGWSGIAWWGGIRFAELIAAFPPAPGARWAALRSAVNLDFHGRPDPYYVSIDLDTARHPQTLLATHQSGRPLTVAHGAPMRLLVPMKLGLKNIKAVTDIAYTASEPPDYWNERGYSKYDGL